MMRQSFFGFYFLSWRYEAFSKFFLDGYIIIINITGDNSLNIHFRKEWRREK